MKTKTLLVIVGPTAIGKTSLSILLANELKTEIISADSRQFFKEMAIGTAKPTEEELQKAPHHFVGFLSINDEYNAGDFEKDALAKLDLLFKTNNVVILVGGSGMYVKALCEGLDDFPSSKELREQLKHRLKTEGINVLQEELLRLDPDHYKKMDIQNPQRLIRAIEVSILAGQPYSSLRKETTVDRPFNIVKIGLKADRETLYNRINHRVDLMVNEGLFEEVKSLLPYRKNNALITVGYREIFEYLDGRINKEEAIELIKRNTRRFSKRQMTWFNKDPEIHWFDYLETKAILSFVKKEF